MITQFPPPDSPGNPVFNTNFHLGLRVTPLQGLQTRLLWVKIDADFRYRHKSYLENDTREAYKMVPCL